MAVWNRGREQEGEKPEDTDKQMKSLDIDIH